MGWGRKQQQILMLLDWQTDKGDTVIQWWHDSLVTHFMLMNNQKSFYRWHIKEHLVHASVNPIEYFTISLSPTCSGVLYLSYKYWIFWLDKLLYRHNPIKGMQCCVSCQWHPHRAVALQLHRTMPCCHYWIITLFVYLDFSFSVLLFHVIIHEQSLMKAVVGLISRAPFIN